MNFDEIGIPRINLSALPGQRFSYFFTLEFLYDLHVPAEELSRRICSEEHFINRGSNTIWFQIDRAEIEHIQHRFRIDGYVNRITRHPVPVVMDYGQVRMGGRVYTSGDFDYFQPVLTNTPAEVLKVAPRCKHDPVRRRKRLLDVE